MLRRLLITLLAYVAGLALTMVALVGIVDVSSLSIDAGLPTVAILTPMIAVVVFWGVARVCGVPVDPARAFLGGGIAIYSLLYLCGRLVDNQLMTGQGATLVGAAALFCVAYLMLYISRERPL